MTATANRRRPSPTPRRPVQQGEALLKAKPALPDSQGLALIGAAVLILLLLTGASFAASYFA